MAEERAVLEGIVVIAMVARGSPSFLPILLEDEIQVVNAREGLRKTRVWCRLHGADPPAGDREMITWLVDLLAT